MSDRLLLLVHAGTTAAMVGVIWAVQLIIYPLLRVIGPAEFTAAHTLHSNRIGFVLLLFAPLEAATAMFLLIRRPPGVSLTLILLGLALLGVAWGATVLFSVPTHVTLGSGQDLAVVDRLISTNWIRTVAWSARGVVALVMLVRSGV